MEHEVGGSARDDGEADGVEKGLLGDDVARFEVGFEQGANSVTGANTFGVFIGVFGGCARRIGQGEAHAFDGAGHGIGGVHAAAGTGARAGVFDNFLAFGIAERFCEKFAVALKGRDDVEFAFFTLDGGATGLYCAAVDHQGRAVEAAHCHDYAGHVFCRSRAMRSIHRTTALP